MKKIYTALLLLLTFANAGAQTVLTTGVPSSPSSLSGSPAPFGVSFIIENTNPYAIIMTTMEVYRGSGSSGMTFSLLYNATSLSGSSNLNTTPGWTAITSTTASTVSTTAIHPTFSGMNFLIPANTVYRFAVTSSGTQIWYGGAATTPNSHTAGGVVIGAGSYQINGQNVGYAGAGGNLTTNPRFWGGTITFAPAAPCAFPPTAGTAVVSNANPCP